MTGELLLRRYTIAGSIGSLLLSATVANATVYYVSPAGNDANAGTAVDQAWRTIEPINKTTFAPGDRVRFEGSKIFYGNLYFDPLDQGSAARPIVIESYGTGRAVIQSGTGFGLYAYNVSGYLLRNINFFGEGQTLGNSSGVLFYNDRVNRTELDYVRIDHVEAQGYGGSGISVGGSNKSGYRNIRLSYVDSHHNALAGITIWGHFSKSSPGYSHKGVRIDHCRAWQNPGKEGLPSNSGSGIVISDVDDGVIEYSVAYENGYLNTAIGGPIGIWAWDANNIVIQHNESHHNRTNSKMDGGGFDLDGGVTDSIMQYNYSHDNDGAGFLLAQFSEARPFYGNTIRYNISQNDARKNSFGAIHVWNGGSGIRSIEIHNNTIYLSSSTSGAPRAVYFQSPTQDVHVRNNILVTTGGLRLVDVAAGQSGVLFQGNDYWASGAAWHVRWAGNSYWALAEWRAATGQETLAGTAVGYRVDPGLVNAGGGGTFNNANSLKWLNPYRLKVNSPMIDAGLDLPGRFGVDDGGRDFFQTSLPQGRAVDIGAHEWLPR